MEQKDFWPTIENTTFAFGPFYQEKMGEAIEATGAPDIWFPLNLARSFEPEAFDLERYRRIDPYTKPERQTEILTTLADAGLLKSTGDGSFHVSAKGHAALENVFGAAHKSLSDIAPLPESELDELTNLLARVVKAALKSDSPAEKWNLNVSRRTDPGEGASYAARIDQYLTDLTVFRDDCHQAAWLPYDLSGPSREVLTVVWRGEASTAEELATRLSYRSYSEEEYAQFAQDLAGQGLIISSADGISLTKEGKQLRQAVEDETERLSSSPFESLPSQDLARLKALLQHLGKKLVIKGRLKVWDLMYRLSSAIGQAGRQAIMPGIEKHGIGERGFLFMLMQGDQFDPQPISVAAISRGGPYHNPEVHAETLINATEAGLFEQVGEGEYRLSPSGRAAIDDVNNTFYLLLGKLPILSPERRERLENLLGQLVEASVAATEPATTVRLDLVHNSHPEKNYGVIAQIDQHLDDILAFRDDAHLAAWQSLDVKPQAWEAFTLVWRGLASDPAKLAEELPYRGYAANEYETALGSLVAKGWMEKTGNGYAVTAAGNDVRQEAEDETNRLFFAPWSVLRQVDVNRLRFLLASLEKEFKELETTTEATP